MASVQALEINFGEAHFGKAPLGDVRRVRRLVRLMAVIRPGRLLAMVEAVVLLVRRLATARVVIRPARRRGMPVVVIRPGRRLETVVDWVAARRSGSHRHHAVPATAAI